MKRPLVHTLAIVAVLATVAALAPPPPSSDRDQYERVGRHVVIRGCSDIHCFRVLVAAVLEHLPGPGPVKWKTYAVLANAGAALAVGRFCVLLGLSGSAAVAAMWIAALGTGSLYSLFDSYTSDPLMYLAGPLMAVAVWQGNIRRAGAIGTVGVFAKEFAWAPLWIFALTAAFDRRWSTVKRLVLPAIGVTVVWAIWHFGLMLLFGYRHGFTRSTHLLDGGYIVMWLNSVGFGGAVTYLFLTFGALYFLLPAGLALGGASVRHLFLASLPAVAAFMYVQQPERALWNFHFIVIPTAVLALQDVPGWMRAAFTAAFGAANLRFGAQLPIPGLARIALLTSLALACAAVAAAALKRTPRPIVPLPSV
jgi:hypothetical protein